MVVLTSKNNSVRIGTCSGYLSKHIELNIIVQWVYNECVLWHLQLEYQDAAGLWSHRGVSGAHGLQRVQGQAMKAWSSPLLD